MTPWLGPLIVAIYLILAIACSAIWLYSFNLEIFEPRDDAVSTTSQQRRTLLTLLVAYAIHLPVLVILPLCSRPWLWKDNSNSNWLRLLSRVFGWDDGGDHWCNCLLGGSRAVASFLIAWAPFAFAARGSRTSMAGILGLAFEGFFVAEMVKHTEAEDGFFMCQMASAACAAQRVFGLGGKEWWTVFGVCISLIFLHSILPYYEDVSTLLPEPYAPGNGAVGVVTEVDGGGAAAQKAPTAQVMSQNSKADVAVPAPIKTQAGGSVDNV